MAINCKAVLVENNPRNRPEDNFKIMLSKFRKRVSDIGVVAEWKKHQFHETKGEKRRRKKKETDLQKRKERAKLHR